jgi:hypothetical protein
MFKVTNGVVEVVHPAFESDQGHGIGDEVIQNDPIGDEVIYDEPAVAENNRRSNQAITGFPSKGFV